MDEHTDILIQIASWAWIALIGVMVWFFRKVSAMQADMQERRGVVNTAVAVLKSSQEDLRKEFDKDAKRNNLDHQRILDRMDTNHNSLMTRIDGLVKVVKNGQ